MPKDSQKNQAGSGIDAAVQTKAALGIVADGTLSPEEVAGDRGEASAGVKNLFKIQTANEWIEDAKTRPVPKKLFDEFWFEGEISILFADTNVGKSILAVQIADGIARGEDVGHFKIETDPQQVIYFDFELTDKQFESRYAKREDNADHFSDHYSFDSNFLRAEISPEAEIDHGFGSFEDYLNNSINLLISDTGAKVLIIDNLTYLRNENEKAKDALPLMKHLKSLKNRFGLSILVLAHTPKRDLSKPIGRNDLQGSKMLINFCDSSFAIGESSLDNHLRYLKQIKVRNAEVKYDSENVCLCEIEKPENFLRFDFGRGFGRESQHLKTITERDRAELIEQVKNLIGVGKSQRDVARELGIGVSTVNKYLHSEK
jgi:hypothetical protein